MKSYYNEFLFLIFLLFLLLSSSCKEEPPVIPPPPPPVLKDTLTISIADITHRSASLNVLCTMNNVQSLVRLYRLFNSNETLVAEFPITVQDTTIIDDNNGTGLQLNTNYFYYVVRIDTLGARKDTSNIVEVATLDTTSHNYTWQEFVIGEWQSALYDVWGTDENNVWAAGTVILNDTAYGVLKWNGTEWIPNKRIGGVRSIFGFNKSDIWAVGEGAVEHFNGTDWIRIDAKIENGHIIVLDPILFSNNPYTSVWGTSSSNLYLGNALGKIIHWDGSKASVVKETGDYLIRDIYGISENYIVAVGRNNSFSSDIVLIYNGNIWQVVSNLPINPEAPSSVILFNSKEIYISGNEIIFGNLNNWSIMQRPSNIYIDKLRGQTSNSLFAVGSFNEVMHYNGIDWHRYTEISTPAGGRLFGVISLGSKAFAVGHSVTVQAKINIGTRN